jgi:protein-S-isoprenylcysteine O-methyltransferase Ste14
MPKTISSFKHKIVAIAYGTLCHGSFICAGFLMFYTLFFGFSSQIVPDYFPTSYVLNGLLILQFPFLHSYLLSASGKTILRIFSPRMFGKKMDTTVYATIASIQLFLLFYFWKPSGVIIWVADGLTYFLMAISYLAGWILLSVSSFQAGYKVQTGALGWTTAYSGSKLNFPPMPEHGLFRIIRHPIYFSFAVILWCSPYFTADKLILAISYSIYCFFAPILKEKRFLSIYGQKFQRYRERTPYFFPKLTNLFNRDTPD